MDTSTGDPNNRNALEMLLQRPLDLPDGVTVNYNCGEYGREMDSYQTELRSAVDRNTEKPGKIVIARVLHKLDDEWIITKRVFHCGVETKVSQKSVTDVNQLKKRGLDVKPFVIIVDKYNQEEQ